MKTRQAIRSMIGGLTPPVFPSLAAKFRKRLKELEAKRRLAGQTKLHLACGRNVLEGWANIDLTGDAQVTGWDLTERLPVESETVDFIFCEHFIEHITLEQANALLSDCYRILRPGGVFRLSTPNLRKLVDEYLAGRLTEWCDVGWTPATPCQLLNEGLRLWGHQFVFDEVELPRALQKAGYPKVIPVAWHESQHKELRNLECRPFHDEVILEATK